MDKWYWRWFYMTKLSDYINSLITEFTNAGYTIFNSIVIPSNDSDTILFVEAQRFDAKLTLPAGRIYSKEGNIKITLSFPMDNTQGISSIDLNKIYDFVDTVVDFILNTDAIKSNINSDTMTINYIQSISPKANMNRVFSVISFNIIL